MKRNIAMGLLAVFWFCGVAVADLIIPDGRSTGLRTIRAEAHVTVSDGLEYDVVTVFHDPQRAVFHLAYPDRKMTLGIDGMYYWQYDGQLEEEGPAMVGGIVLGHQIHALLLYFDRINPLSGDPVEGTYEGVPGLTLESVEGRTLHIATEPARPLALIISREDGPDIVTTFENWRAVEGVSLPFTAHIDDGERVFRYQYDSVVFDEGNYADYRAPVEILTDEQALMRRHRISMDAHFFCDASLMENWFADETVVAYQGEVIPSSGEKSAAMMARIFGNRLHTRYDDLMRPVVRVSDDGTLGWVLVRVKAEGVRLDAQGEPTGPLDFTSAWVSLFSRQEDGWKQVGNVSNFQPTED